MSFAGVIAAPFILVGVWNIVNLRAGADTLGYARLAEIASARSDPGRYAFLATFELPDTPEGSASFCVDALSRAALTIRLAKLDAARGGALVQEELQRRRAAALAAVDRRLRCSPVDGNAWLWRAKILGETGASREAVTAALKASYRFAPAEAWIMIPRFAFATPRLEAGDADAEPAFDVDLRTMASNLAPQTLAELFIWSGPVVRRKMRAEIRALPTPRRRPVLGWIDRLGVDTSREP